MNNNYYSNQTNPYGYTPNLNNDKINIDSVFKINKGKKVTVYQTFKDNEKKSFNGIIECSGNNYIILSDPKNGNWFLLLTDYTDFIKFDEDINTNQVLYNTQF